MMSRLLGSDASFCFRSFLVVGSSRKITEAIAATPVNIPYKSLIVDKFISSGLFKSLYITKRKIPPNVRLKFVEDIGKEQNYQVWGQHNRMAV